MTELLPENPAKGMVHRLRDLGNPHGRSLAAAHRAILELQPRGETAPCAG